MPVIPGADDADIRLFRPAQRRAGILPVRGGGVIGGDMAAFSHDLPPASSATPSSAQTMVMLITISRMR